MRAFIIDDQPSILRLLVAVLHHKGWKAESFSNPTLMPCPLVQGGNCNHRSGCCDAIITDIHMPKMSGLDLMHRLRDQGCTCRHLLVISGECSDDEEATIRELGHRLLRKPLDLEAIRAWLTDLEPRRA
jgi:two-component system OmpR family response regulator